MVITMPWYYVRYRIRIVLEIIYEHIKLCILANFKAPIKRYVTFIYAINMFRLV